MIIYRIANIINNKCYIGQTRQVKPNNRIKSHFNKSKPKYNSAIWQAINKYGKDNFKTEILYITGDKANLNQKEQYFIKEYNSLIPNGYNIQVGGQTNKFTEETRKKNV